MANPQNNFTAYVIAPLASMFTTSFFMTAFRNKGGGNGYGKGFQHQADISDANLQAATGKVPPTWSPERSRHYSLRTYERDLGLWAAASDVDEARMGPLVALRLGGSAKILAREMDLQVLANGIDVLDGGNNMVHLSGIQFLLRQLKRRYAPLDQEIQITAIADIWHFKRRQGESTDECLSRFDLALNEAEVNGQVQFVEVLRAWMIMNILAIPKNHWALLLAPTQGALPNNLQQYMQFLQYVRRDSHLWEESRGITQHYFGEEPTMASTDDWHSPPPHYTPSDLGETFTTASYFDHADDEMSSGCSNDDEPVNLPELTQLDVNTAGELIYLEYRTAKRRFRKFTKQPGRGRKGKGKGKGHKGKGKPTYFWDEMTYSYVQIHDDHESSYAFQKGGKGNGKGVRKGNPIGPDGKTMLCSICKSPEHFQRFCPQNPKGKGKSTSGFAILPSEASHWSQEVDARPGVASTRMYFANSTQECSTKQFHASIEYEDGSIEELASGSENALRLSTYLSASSSTFQPAVEIPGAVSFSDMTEAQRKLWSFPWWPNIYHTQVRLASGQEGLLVDCGAMTDLCGDRWASRVASLAEKAGQGTKWSKIPGITVEGVGKEADTITDQAAIPICLDDGSTSVYKAIVSKDSDLPALYGLIRMTEQQAVVDTGNDRIIYPGPGGIKYTLSPGSKVYALQRALSGHLLLPCAEWNKRNAGKGGAPASR